MCQIQQQLTPFKHKVKNSQSPKLNLVEYECTKHLNLTLIMIQWATARVATKSVKGKERRKKKQGTKYHQIFVYMYIANQGLFFCKGNFLFSRCNLCVRVGTRKFFQRLFEDRRLCTMMICTVIHMFTSPATFEFIYPIPIWNMTVQNITL